MVEGVSETFVPEEQHDLLYRCCELNITLYEAQHRDEHVQLQFKIKINH